MPCPHVTIQGEEGGEITTMTEDMYFCIMHKLKWYKGLVMDLRTRQSRPLLALSQYGHETWCVIG